MCNIHEWRVFVGGRVFVESTVRYIHQLVMSLKATPGTMWCRLVNQKGAVV